MTNEIYNPSFDNKTIANTDSFVNGETRINRGNMNQINSGLKRAASFIGQNITNIAEIGLALEALNAFPLLRGKYYDDFTDAIDAHGFVEDNYQSKLTVDASSGTNILTVESTEGRVVGEELTIQDNTGSNYEFVYIQSVDSETQLTLTSNLVNSYTVANNALVYRSINGKVETLENFTGDYYVMTSNTAPAPFVATAVGNSQVGQPYNAFDSNRTGRIYMSDNDGYVQIDFGNDEADWIIPKVLDLHMLSDNTTNVKVLGSTDGVNFIEIYSNSGNVNNTNVQVDTVLDVPVRYLRFQINSPSTVFQSWYHCHVIDWDKKTGQKVSPFFKRKKLTANENIPVSVIVEEIRHNDNALSYEKAVSFSNDNSESYNNMDLDVETIIQGIGIIWDKETDMNILPNSDGWTKTESGSPTISLSNGILNLITDSTDLVFYQIETNNIDTNKTVVVESKLKVNVSNGNALYPSQQLRINDGTKSLQLYFETNKISYLNSSTALIDVGTVDLQTDFKKIRVEFNATDGVDVYVDDVLLGNIAYSNLINTAANYIFFGDPDTISGNYSADVEYDYIYYTLDKQVAENMKIQQFSDANIDAQGNPIEVTNIFVRDTITQDLVNDVIEYKVMGGVN